MRPRRLLVAFSLLTGSCSSQLSTESASQAAVAVDPISSNLGSVVNGGGCYPPLIGATGLAQLILIDPEWAPVVNGTSPISAPVLLHGTADDSHVSREDFPSTHVLYDQNTGIRLDPADAGLVATGNAGEGGLLELEWETGAYPAWAWAGEGDRIVALGRWIFDCGHPDPIPGTCNGTAQPCLTALDCAAGVACSGTVWNYRSELHPPQAVAVIREGRGAVLGDEDDATLATRGDVFVSADGGGAGDRCVVTHVDPNPIEALLAVNCFPLSAPLALLPEASPAFYAQDFEFDIPLPPRPRGGAARWRVVTHDTPAIGGTQVPARLDIEPHVRGPSPFLHASVRMTQMVGATRPTGFAATILAGWQRPDEPALAHVRVTYESITVRAPLKPEIPGIEGHTPPGWKLQGAVNGEWQELSGAEGVVAGSAGQTFGLGAAFDQWLPRRGSLRVQLDGGSRSCNDTVIGQSLGADLVVFGGDIVRASTCLATRAEPDPGRVDVTFAGPDFGAGVHDLWSRGGDASSCSASGGACTVDSDCPAGESCVGAYRLRARIERLE